MADTLQVGLLYTPLHIYRADMLQACIVLIWYKLALCNVRASESVDYVGGGWKYVHAFMAGNGTGDAGAAAGGVGWCGAGPHAA